MVGCDCDSEDGDQNCGEKCLHRTGRATYTCRAEEGTEKVRRGAEDDLRCLSEPLRLFLRILEKVEDDVGAWRCFYMLSSAITKHVRIADEDRNVGLISGLANGVARILAEHHHEHLFLSYNTSSPQLPTSTLLDSALSRASNRPLDVTLRFLRKHLLVNQSP